MGVNKLTVDYLEEFKRLFPLNIEIVSAAVGRDPQGTVRMAYDQLTGYAGGFSGKFRDVSDKDITYWFKGRMKHVTEMLEEVREMVESDCFNYSRAIVNISDIKTSLDVLQKLVRYC